MRKDFFALALDANNGNHQSTQLCFMMVMMNFTTAGKFTASKIQILNSMIDEILIVKVINAMGTTVFSSRAEQ